MKPISLHSETILADLTDRKRFSAMVKILCILAIKLQGGRIAQLKKEIGNTAYPDAVALLKRFKTNTKNFENLYAHILQDSKGVLPLVEPFLNDFKGMMKSANLKADLESLSTDTKDLLNPIITLLNNPNSANAFSAVARRVGNLHEAALTQKMNEIYKEVQVDNTSDSAKELNVDPSTKKSLIGDIVSQIKVIGERITGRKNVTTISTADKNEYKKDPAKAELVKRFEALRKQLNDSKLNEIRMVVSASGKDHVSVAELIKGLKRRGITELNIPKAFMTSTQIHINTLGQYCDSEGRILNKQNPDPSGVITFNPKYSHTDKGNNWVYLVKSPAGIVNRVYTLDKVQDKKSDRFEKTTDIVKTKLDDIKTSWRGDMNANEIENERVIFAHIAEYIYWTASRVGSGIGMTEGTRTYGASNFLVKHIKNLPRSTKKVMSRLDIEYPIKSGAVDEFILSSNLGDLPTPEDSAYMKRLIAFICKKAAGKGPEDLVWTVDGKRLSTDKLNTYLNSLEPGLTAKSFRTIRGTQLALIALEQAKEAIDGLTKQSKKPVPDTTVNQVFDQALTSVGELLGHVRRVEGGERSTSATAISSYVNPAIMIKWYKDIKRQPPRKVINAARNAGLEV